MNPAPRRADDERSRLQTLHREPLRRAWCEFAVTSRARRGPERSLDGTAHGSRDRHLLARPSVVPATAVATLTDAPASISREAAESRVTAQDLRTAGGAWAADGVLGAGRRLRFDADPIRRGGRRLDPRGGAGRWHGQRCGDGRARRAATMGPGRGGIGMTDDWGEHPVMLEPPVPVSVLAGPVEVDGRAVVPGVRHP